MNYLKKVLKGKSYIFAPDVLKKKKKRELPSSPGSSVCKFQIESLNCISGWGSKVFLLSVIAKSSWGHLTQDTSANSSPFDCYLTYSQSSCYIKAGIKFPVQIKWGIASALLPTSTVCPHGLQRTPGREQALRKAPLFCWLLQCHRTRIHPVHILDFYLDRGSR